MLIHNIVLTLARFKCLESKIFLLGKATSLLKCLYLELHFLAWVENENFEGGNDVGAGAGTGDLGHNSLSPELLTEI